MYKKVLNWIGLIFSLLVFLRSSSYLALKIYAFGRLEAADYFVMVPMAVAAVLIFVMYVRIIFIKKRVAEQ